MRDRGRAIVLWAPLAWLLTGLSVTAPIWLIVGARGLVLGLLGPVGLLLFKPGENQASKWVLVVLLSAPVLAGLTLVIRKWSGLGPTFRIFCVVGLSVLWHGLSAGLWVAILSGLN